MLQVKIISRLKFFNLVESQFPELGLGEKGNRESTQAEKNLNLILTCNNYNRDLKIPRNRCTGNG